MRYFSWIITLPLALLILSFALSNRQSLPLQLWPLPFVAEVPAYLPVLGSLLIGFTAGALMMWAGGYRYRRTARISKKKVERLEKDLAQKQEPVAVQLTTTSTALAVPERRV